MTQNEFKKLIRGDVVRWTGDDAPFFGDLGLVCDTTDGVRIVWEDRLSDLYTAEDAVHLERWP